MAVFSELHSHTAADNTMEINAITNWAIYFIFNVIINVQNYNNIIVGYILCFIFDHNACVVHCVNVI